MFNWHEIFEFFVDDLGVPQNEVRCTVHGAYTPYLNDYEIQVYGVTAIVYRDGSFWIPQFIELVPSDPLIIGQPTRISVLGRTKCIGHWKDGFMKILPNFNKYIRQ